jgi:hypothetical protein
MKRLQLLMLWTVCIVGVMQASLAQETNPLPKHLEVFGMRVCATTAASNDKILDAINVVAE